MVQCKLIQGEQFPRQRGREYGQVWHRFALLWSAASLEDNASYSVGVEGAHVLVFVLLHELREPIDMMALAEDDGPEEMKTSSGIPRAADQSTGFEGLLVVPKMVNYTLPYFDGERR